MSDETRVREATRLVTAHRQAFRDHESGRMGEITRTAAHE